jgi:MFS family permease
VCWGLVSTLTSQVRSYRGIVAARFFLGIVEAPFFPGALFYLSKWYTKEEMAKRNAIFFAGSLVSGAFGSLIAAGILSGLSGSLGMAAWQWYVGLRTQHLGSCSEQWDSQLTTRAPGSTSSKAPSPWPSASARC